LSTPGVSDDVEVDSVLGSVSDSGDSVIEVGSAVSLQDSLAVKLESVGTSSNSDGDNSDVEGGNESL